MTWDLFISHASEHQLEITCPLADMLLRKGINVWYAAYGKLILQSQMLVTFQLFRFGSKATPSGSVAHGLRNDFRVEPNFDSALTRCGLVERGLSLMGCGWTARSSIWTSYVI